MEKAIEKAKGIEPKDLHKIVMVGGSTKMDFLKKHVENYLVSRNVEDYKSKVNMTLDPDQAIAYGAAIQAAIITGEISVQERVTFQDVTPLTIGMKIFGDNIKELIPACTNLPKRT